MTIYKSKKLHQTQITQLQKQIRIHKTPVALCSSKNPSNTLRNSTFKKKGENIDISHLNKILKLDVENHLLIVEPKINVKRLTHLLLQHNVMLPVVPEFSSITVGGAIIGSSLESSSHRFGQFNDLCLEYELILGDGTLVKASAKENSDLFHALPGSYGTLALLTAVTMKLIKAKKYVHLTYKRFWDYHNLLEQLKAPHLHDFVEGILFSKAWGVAIEGKMCDYLPTLPLNKQSHFYKPWYYQHLLEKTKEGSFEEIMPLKDYLFRFDRAAFWMGRFIGNLRVMLQIVLRLRLENVAKSIQRSSKKLQMNGKPSWWFRAFFAPFLSSKYLYKIWHKVPNHISEQLFFIQDFYTPISQTEHILNKCIDSTHIFPIWLCPIKNSTQGQFLSPHYHEERMINIGLYGIPQINIPIPLLTKKLEEELYECGGKKMLYSYTYYDERVFSKMYDGKSYEKLREKYGASNSFYSLYNKVTNNS